MHYASHRYAYADRFAITSANLICSGSETFKPPYQREIAFTNL